MTITASPSSTGSGSPEVAILDNDLRRSSSIVTLVLGLLTPVVLVALGYWLTRNVDARNSGVLGLIQVMPPTFFAVIALLAASFVWHLRSEASRNLVLAMHVIGLIALFHGTVSWIEQTPRFPVAYTHMGFIDYIQRNDAVLPNVDARFSWPGFFAMGAMLNDVAGINTSYSWMLWAPLFFNLTYAPLVFSIARAVSTDRRVAWLTTYTFFSVTWVGQDYFAPQAINFLLFLAFMTIVFHFFRTDRASLPRGVRTIGSRVSRIIQAILRTEPLRPGGAPVLPATAIQRIMLLGALIVIFGATIFSHQLTPFFILFNLVVLVVLRRTALRGLPLLLIVLEVSYISYGAVGYWSGHLSDLIGGVGQVGSVAEQNVGSKVQASTDHTYVIYSRLALSAGVWLVAAFGVLRRLRKGRTDLFVLVGFFAPFLVLGGQSYGGEAILRVFLFSLPFTSILVALALLPIDKIKLNAIRSVAIVLVATACGPLFYLTRYGNEQYEMVTKDEYIGTQELMKIAPPGSQVVGIGANTAWAIKNIEDYRFRVARNLEPFDNPNLIYEQVASRGTRSTYLFVPRTQLQVLAVNDGRPKNWGEGFERSLIDSGRFTLIYENPDVAIFAIAPTGG